MADILHNNIRAVLKEKRTRLESALELSPDNTHFASLIKEIDDALKRLNKGNFGLCKVCDEPIESDRLIADPLLEFCLDHLTRTQKQAFEQDMKLAAQIQEKLLPEKRLKKHGWNAIYHYEGAGVISGDYCDILASNNDIYFTVGDVSGKGISAALLMSHLHATFRTLISLELPLDKIVERASRMFCESTMPTHFATLVICKASPNGNMEICNAGHNPPIIIHHKELEYIKAKDLPLGIFCGEQFSIYRTQFKKDDVLFIYTDGLSESFNKYGKEYGINRLSNILKNQKPVSIEQYTSIILEDLNKFRDNTSRSDDLTMMFIQRINVLHKRKRKKDNE